MFLALDLSLTCIGWARTSASGSGPEVGVIKPRGKSVIRLQYALNHIVGLVKESAPKLVLLENYAFGKANKAHQLGELGGVVRLALHQSRVWWTEASPASIKKLATGSGNAKKEAVLAAAIRRLGYQGSSFDEADARWLLEAARIHYDVPGAAKLPQNHLGLIDSITWPVVSRATAETVQ